MEALSSAVAQEGVSRVSSFITSNLADDDVASREIMMEMAVSKLEFAIERSGKLPITDASLLWRRQVIKRACTEGKELLRTHKQQQQRLEDREEVGQVVTASSFLGRFTHAANRSILSSSAVKNFEMYAEWADKFLKDVESGCILRPHMISNNSLVRRLLEWRTLRCSTVKGFRIWATRYEERGVEAYLDYTCGDPKMPEKYFHLTLGLRLSESTNIIGTAIKCLQPLASQFKAPIEFAMGELSQQGVTASDLLEFSPSREHALVPLKKHCAYISRLGRPDPVCCRPNEHGPSANNTVSSELSHICPEEVIFLRFLSSVLLEKRYSLRRSSDEAGRSVMLPLKLEVAFMPHFYRGVRWLLGGVERSFSYEYGINHKIRAISIQEVLDKVGSTAIHSYLHRPELTRFGINWFSKHGAAMFLVQKPTTRRSAKRKR